MAKASVPRTIHCYHCRHRFEVSPQTLTATCPKCAKHLQLEDVVVKVTYSVRKIQTCGRLLVQKKGRVIAQSVEAHGGVEVEGALEANVLSGGPVRIRSKAQWKGDCAAPSLEVELGGQIDKGYFVIPHNVLELGAPSNGQK
jgi:Polymer-forming cytoskeletal